MPAQIIPLTSQPVQVLQITLTIDNGNQITLLLTVRFQEMAGHWVLTIADSTGVVIVDSIPLLTGRYPAANLLQQHGYLNIGSWYIINVSGISQDFPGSTNLGTDFVLLVDDTAVSTIAA